MLRYFFPKPAAVLNKDYNIYFILSLICIFATLMTLVMLPIAYVYSSGKLALYALYPFSTAIAVHYFNVRGKHFVGVVLVFTLTYIFTVISTLYFGWDAGFQYYLITGIAIFILYPYLNNKALAVMSVIYVSTFLILYLASSHAYSDNIKINFILHTFNALVSISVIGVSNLYFRSNAQYLIDKFNFKASTDLLTGLHSRRNMNQLLSRFSNEIQAHHQPTALILIDIDHFKVINNKYGHATGDKILYEIANLLKAKIRDTDEIARWGGDEFLIMAPFTYTKEASQLVNNLHSCVRDFVFLNKEQKIKLTITCSLTEISNAQNLESALSQVDSLNLQGKNNGRDQVVYKTKESTIQEI